jgi:hypothetical protein
MPGQSPRRVTAGQGRHHPRWLPRAGAGCRDRTSALQSPPRRIVPSRGLTMKLGMIVGVLGVGIVSAAAVAPAPSAARVPVSTPRLARVSFSTPTYLSTSTTAAGFALLMKHASFTQGQTQPPQTYNGNGGTSCSTLAATSQCSTTGSGKECSSQGSGNECSAGSGNNSGCSSVGAGVCSAATGGKCSTHSTGNGGCSTSGTAAAKCSATGAGSTCSSWSNAECTAFQGGSGSHCSVTPAGAAAGAKCTFGWQEFLCSTHPPSGEGTGTCSVEGQTYGGGMCPPDN